MTEDGAYASLPSVSSYLADGAFTKLPDLQTSRHSHACAVFTTSNGQKALLVVGGITEQNKPASSTEILLSLDLRWTFAASLPEGRSLTGAQAVSFGDGKMLLLGGRDSDSGKISDKVLRFSEEVGQVNKAQDISSTSRWTEFGNMMTPRANHAIAVVTNIEPFCH